MILVKRNLEVAENIVSIVMNDTRTNELTDWQLECYQNGREQGYSLVAYKDSKMTAITFSEHRNSDKIVVYIGTPEYQGISKEAYDNAKYFDTGHYDEAAEYIINFMLAY